MSANAFEFKERITSPVGRVFELLRDRLVEVVAYMPNVASVSVRERTEEGGKIHIVNEWQGKPTAAPKVIQPFISPELARWTDIADWDNAAMRVDWRFETEKFVGLYTCEGTNYFEADGNETVVRLTGSLVLHANRVPGIPKMLARSIAPKIEAWLLKMLTPNLSELPRAVQAFLDVEN